MGWPRWDPSSHAYGTDVSLQCVTHRICNANTGYSDSYGAQVSAEELVMSVSNHKSLREDNTSMLLFGNGDGGGGPLPTMVMIKPQPTIFPANDPRAD